MLDAHRLMIICGLCGIKCAELHGNLTQVQRLEIAANSHDFSNTQHRRSELVADTLEFLKVPSGHFEYTVIQTGLEAGGSSPGYRVSES